jgi:SAM-dependent methyltransferase
VNNIADDESIQFGFHTEIQFWRGQMLDIKNGVEPSLAWRLLPREFEARYMELVSVERRSNPRVLDVGSGPFTHHGSLREGKSLDLTCIDPLAQIYRDLSVEFGIKPPISPIPGRGERLVDLFAPNSFDLVTSTNALDHSLSPLAAIGQALEVCRSGGTVYIEVCENEGEHEAYFGLHKHNFTIADGDLCIWRPDGFRVNVTDVFGHLINESHTDATGHPWRKWDWGSRFISASFKKV